MGNFSLNKNKAGTIGNYILIIGIILFSTSVNYSYTLLFSHSSKAAFEGTQTFIKKLPDDAPTVYMVGQLVTFELKIACSSLTTGCGDAAITDIIPTGLEFVNAGFPINTSGDYDEATKTFTAIATNLEEGDSRIITINCRVTTEAAPGENITNEACSSIATPANSGNANVCSSVQISIANTPLSPAWIVRKNRVGATIVLDQPVSYRIQICAEQAILNTNLFNPTLVDYLPPGVIVSDTADGTYDNSNNTVSWILEDLLISDLYGDSDSEDSKCVDRVLTIIYPSSDYTTGDIVSNEVIGAGTFAPTGGSFSASAIASETIVTPDPKSVLSKSIASSVEAGTLADFKISIENTGNIPLENFQVIDIWTHDYELANIRTPKASSHDYILEISVDGGLSWIQEGIYENEITVSFPAGNTINGIRLSPFDDGDPSLPNFLGVGAKMKSDSGLRVRFQIPSESTASIENCVSDVADNYGFIPNTDVCDSAIIIEPTPDLPRPDIGKRISPNSINPGEEFIVRLDKFAGNATNECVSNPILADLLPPEMEFLYFKEFRRGSKNTGAPPPTFELIENYNNTGRTLVRFSWGNNPPVGALNTDGEPAIPNPYCINGYGGNNNEKMWIEFVAGLKPGVLSGTYQNTACIFTEVGDCENTVVDIHDLDGNNNHTETICNCDNAAITLIGGASIKGQKWVRGAVELGIEDDPGSAPEIPDTFCPQTSDGFTRFPCIANSYQNGIFDFRLVTINQGDAPLKDLVLYDVLPYVNDVGVSEGLSSSLRFSDWRPELIQVEAGNSLTQNSGYVIEYSVSENAARPELSDDMTESGWQSNSVNDWSITPPNPIGTVRAIKITIPFSDTNYWQPGDSLIFDMQMHIPLSVDFNSIAWNSFAYRATNVNTASRLLTAEPRKAGIQIPPSGEIDCFINVDNINQSACNNNITPDFVSDDYFTVSLSASAFNFGSTGQFEVVINANENGEGGIVLGATDYNQSITLGNGANGEIGTFRANGSSTYNLTIRDVDEPSCFTTILTTPVNSCFQEVDCAIQVVLEQPVYDTNQTPADVSDDTFSFFATISGQGSQGWTGGGQSGEFGDTVNYGPYPVDGAGAVFQIYDSTNTKCAVSIGVNMSSCIYLETCTCCKPD